jgi:hypothetical protein
MKALIVSLGLGLAVAGCNMPSSEDQVEASIRNNLSAQGNVQQVEMSQQGDNMSGFAVVRDRAGIEGRFACTAQKSGTEFNWHCNQQVDDQVIQRMETTIRDALARQGEVRQVELSRQDDNRMTGYALVVTPDGTETRLDCTATRPSMETTQFTYQCNPTGAGQAPAGDTGGK